MKRLTDISIHVPRAGYDFFNRVSFSKCTIFLSTYPVRGTTCAMKQNQRLNLYFYPRTPCGVRPYPCASCHSCRCYFYPRTPCGVRLDEPREVVEAAVFLSTYPVRGTTVPRRFPLRPCEYFYPRTPCGVRRDHGAADLTGRHFYPRTPCGVRPAATTAISCRVIFLSTYPVRGTTERLPEESTVGVISIHVPRAGYDL